MAGLQHIGSIVKQRSSYDINDNIVSNKYVNKYALDKTKFTPNTPEATIAEEISKSYNDLRNYAFYFGLVKKIGVQEALRLHAVVQDEIKRKALTSTPVRFPSKFFTYTYEHKKY